MTYTALLLSLIFVCIPLLLSKTLKLGLERDTLIATFRSIVQLLAVGYILKFIFEANSYIYIFLMVALMIIVATLNARKKGAGIKGDHLENSTYTSDDRNSDTRRFAWL